MNNKTLMKIKKKMNMNLENNTSNVAVAQMAKTLKDLSMEKDYEVIEDYPEVEEGPKEVILNIEQLKNQVDQIINNKFTITQKKINEVTLNAVTELELKVIEKAKSIKDTLIDEITKGRQTIVLPTGAPINIGYMDHPATADVLFSVSQFKKVLCVGPAGAGKTYMIEEIAKKLGLPFYKYSCSRDSNVQDLIGYKQPASETYLQTVFLNAYENGGVFLADK